jgi:ribosomal protein L16 Arg81 hydroxylase
MPEENEVKNIEETEPLTKDHLLEDGLNVIKRQAKEKRIVEALKEKLVKEISNKERTFKHFLEKIDTEPRDQEIVPEKELQEIKESLKKETAIIIDKMKTAARQRLFTIKEGKPRPTTTFNMGGAIRSQ